MTPTSADFFSFFLFCTIFPAQRWKHFWSLKAATSFPFFHFNFYPENCCSLDISSFSWSFPVNRSHGCAGKSQQKSLKSPFCLSCFLNFSTMTAVFTWMHRVEQVCLITSNIVQKRQKKPKQIVLLQVKRVHFRQLWTCLKIHPLKRAGSPDFKGSGR